MKKVYIVTFHNVLNVGANLQAYALQQYILSIGFDAYILDYNPWSFLFKKYRPAVGLLKSFKKLKRISIFNKFKTDHLRLTREKLFDPLGIETIVQPYAYVCGSDQVWNPILTNKRFDAGYTLNFDTESIKCSYAASAGGFNLASDKKGVYEFACQFKSIGVRERSAEVAISEIVKDIPISTVLDPTLIWDDYNDITVGYPVVNSPYIVSYEVSDGNTRSNFNLQVKSLKSVLDLPVVHLGAYPINSADINHDVVGPGEWLSHIINSEYVITNSFHGVALSIKFNKRFLFINHLDSEKNVRPHNLLKILGLLHLAVDSVEYSKQLFFDQYDCSDKLANFVDDSRHFLKSALSID